MVKSKATKTGIKHIKNAPILDENVVALEDSTQDVYSIGLHGVLDFTKPLIIQENQGVIIITHNRESALSLRQAISKNVGIKVCLAIRGNNSQTEAEKLEKNSSFVIATPDRLNFHMENTRKCNWGETKYLIVDGLDVIIKSGHLPILENIMSKLPQGTLKRILTNSRDEICDGFVSRHLCNPKIIEEQLDLETKNLSHHSVNVDSDKKFLLLYTLLSRNQTKKCICIFSCASEVKFFKKLLECLSINTLSSSPQISDDKNLITHESFANGECKFLLSTMFTLKDMKMNDLDLLIFYDIPIIADYLQFARLHQSIKGKIIFFIDAATDLTKNSLLSFSTMNFTSNKLLNIQPKIEKIIERNYEIHKAARNGYRDYILSSKRNDYQLVAKSFGLAKAPLVNGIKDE